jgi:ATP-dependent helicase HrpA
MERIRHLPRYVDCLRIRAQRGADNPAKEAEKARKVEDFFWLLEEYKISVFAQELKTALKVSVKRLEKELHLLSTML